MPPSLTRQNSREAKLCSHITTSKSDTGSVLFQLTAVIGFPATLKIGLCVPNSCDGNDTVGLLNTREYSGY